RDLRRRDSEEAGDLRRVRHFRAARHAARDSVSPRRRGTRDRHESRRLLDLLCRPDRGRGAGRPPHRVAVLRDVDPEFNLPAHVDSVAPRGAPRRQHRAWRRLGGAARNLVRLVLQDSGALVRVSLPPVPRLTVPIRVSTLDRYLLSEWLRVFLVTLLGFPILVIVIDLTDKLDTYMARGIKPSAVALSYVFDLPEKMFLVLPVAVLFATVFTVGALGRHSELTAAKASGISF